MRGLLNRKRPLHLRSRGCAVELQQKAHNFALVPLRLHRPSVAQHRGAAERAQLRRRPLQLGIEGISIAALLLFLSQPRIDLWENVHESPVITSVTQ